MARASAAEWAKRVERWKESGLTAKEFGAETGLNASTLSFWRWKLGASAAAPEVAKGVCGGGSASAPKQPREPRKARSRPRSAAPESRQFIELSAATVTSVQAGLEIVVDDGMRVRVPVGFDEETLTRLLRAIGAGR